MLGSHFFRYWPICLMSHPWSWCKLGQLTAVMWNGSSPAWYTRCPSGRYLSNVHMTCLIRSYRDPVLCYKEHLGTPASPLAFFKLEYFTRKRHLNDNVDLKYFSFDVWLGKNTWYAGYHDYHNAHAWITLMKHMNINMLSWYYLTCVSDTVYQLVPGTCPTNNISIESKFNETL